MKRVLSSDKATPPGASPRRRAQQSMARWQSVLWICVAVAVFVAVAAWARLLGE